MAGHRVASSRADETFWYGPFEGRWGRALVPLAIGLLLALLAIQEERSTFRAIACTRSPPRCTVSRGTALLGVREAESFDPSSTVLTQRQTKSRTPLSLLVVVDARGGERVLAEGAPARALLPQLAPFFAADPRAPTSVAVRAPAAVEGWMGIAAAAAVASCLAAWFGWRSLRASRRVRIQVLHGEGLVRVDRMGLFGPRRRADVPIDDIMGVAVLPAGSGGDSRVCLMCRTGLDVPLLDHGAPGAQVHEALAALLSAELGVRGPRAG